MLLLAAALIFLTGAAHSYLGERYILIRLFRREDLPRLFGGTAFTIGTLRFAWHLTTVAWWGFAYVAFIASQGPVSTDQVLATVGGVALVSAAFPLYFTRGRHLSWIVFLIVGVLAFLARGVR
jgi:hypothetical protein